MQGNAPSRIEQSGLDGLPVACTLGAGEGAARMARWQRLARNAAPSARRSGRELEVRYQARRGVREELEALAAAEAECCSFVTWAVDQEGEQVVLRVAADERRPDDIAPIAAMFDATRSRVRRHASGAGARR